MEVKPTILAADDNEDALYALSRILSHHGYEVVTAGTGDQALQKAEEVHPTAAVLDVVMPGMSGFELAQRFKNHAVPKFVPVILVTARDSLEDVLSGLEHEVWNWIVCSSSPPGT